MELTEHFRRLYSEKHGRQLNLSDRNMEMFRSYHWPGNVRELENMVENYEKISWSQSWPIPPVSETPEPNWGSTPPPYPGK